MTYQGGAAEGNLAALRPRQVPPQLTTSSTQRWPNLSDYGPADKDEEAA